MSIVVQDFLFVSCVVVVKRPVNSLETPQQVIMCMSALNLHVLSEFW